MIRLNLLSEKSKQEVRQQRLFVLFLKTELILTLLIIAGGAIFFTAEKMLSASVLKLSGETSRIIKVSGDTYGLEVKKINESLAAVSDIQKDFIPYSRLLKNISALTPDGVSLTYLKINTPTKAIKIRGRAILRENLLALEKNLKNAPCLTKVEIPIADKLKKENIDFDIDLEFDPSQL